MMLRVFVFLLFLFAVNQSFAIDVNIGNTKLYCPVKELVIKDSLPYPKDTIWPKTIAKYYDDYSNMLGLFLYAKQKYTSLAIYDKKNNKSIEYTPNKQLNVGFGFNYKWLGIGIAFKLGFLNNDDELYGKTKRMDWQTNIYLNKVVFDFYLQHYKSFYVNNPADVFSGWTGGDNPYVRPDIESLSLGLSGMYVFNHDRFSYKAAFLQTAVQKKSAGSFLLGGSVFVQGLSADSSIFPSQSDFSYLPAITNHAAIYYGVLTAYAYNFTIRDYYFISISLSASLSLGNTASGHKDGTVIVAWVPTIHLQPRMAFGYNKPKWYAGFSFVRDSYFEGSDEVDASVDFSFNSGNFRIFLGRRFNWLSRKELR